MKSEENLEDTLCKMGSYFTRGKLYLMRREELIG